MAIPSRNGTAKRLRHFFVVGWVVRRETQPLRWVSLRSTQPTIGGIFHFGVGIVMGAKLDVSTFSRKETWFLGLRSPTRLGWSTSDPLTAYPKSNPGTPKKGPREHPNQGRSEK